MDKRVLINELIEHLQERKGKVVFQRKTDENGEWQSIQWKDFLNDVDRLARALLKLGVKEFDHLAVYSQNMVEMITTDLAHFSNRAITVPIYATSSPSQIEYIVKDAGIETIFVGEQLQYDNVREVMKKSSLLKHLILYSKDIKRDETDKVSIYYDDFIRWGDKEEGQEVINQRRREATAEDLAFIVYTSGTSGIPKGVMLTQDNIIAALEFHDIRLTKLGKNELSVAFLPFAHVLEKMWTLYCLHAGIEVAVNLRPTQIQKTIKELHPTLMCCVPRFWEKVYCGVQDKINSAKGLTKTLMLKAIEVGKRRNLDYERLGKKAPFGLELQYRFFHKMVFEKLKKAIGIERCTFFPTAGAMLSTHINEFFHACGIDICYGYGLTETTATVSCFEAQGYKFGTVGKVLNGVQVKIGEENEILVKGRTVMKGYYNKPQENEQAFIDGWFRTGDAGKLDSENHLTMTERIKELYKTANGKYIAPQVIESMVGENPFVEQIMIIGDQRKFVSALIVPAYDKLEKYARENDIFYTSIEDLLQKTEIKNLIANEIKKEETTLAPFETIKRFKLLPKPFSMENGELTNTLKIKRRVVYQRYSPWIDEMYKDSCSKS